MLICYTRFDTSPCLRFGASRAWLSKHPFGDDVIVSLQDATYSISHTALGGGVMTLKLARWDPHMRVIISGKVVGWRECCDQDNDE